MRVDDALRSTRRSARVDDQRTARRIGLARWRGRGVRIDRHGARAHLLREPPGRGRVRGRGDDDGGFAVLDDVGLLGFRMVGMDRHRDRAGFPAREERGDIVVARRAQHRDPRLVQVVGTVEQRAGESRRIRVELPIRPGPGQIDNRPPIAEGSHPRAEIVHCETPPSASASLPTRSKNSPRTVPCLPQDAARRLPPSARALSFCRCARARLSAWAALAHALTTPLSQGRDQQDPLFLQAKKATTSVLEDYLPKSRYAQAGERVVQGQRMMQAASVLRRAAPGRGRVGSAH